MHRRNPSITNIPKDAFKPIASPDITFVAGSVWIVRDSNKLYYVNIASQRCSCQEFATCLHLRSAEQERDRLVEIIGCDPNQIPDSEQLLILAIERGFNIVMKAA